MSTNDEDRRRAAWFPLLVSLLVVGTLVIATIASGDDPAPAPVAVAAQETTATAGAATTAPPTDGTTTTAPAAAEPVPAEVQEDPLVQRLAKGRTLPFTAGPWKKAAWRDGVYTRLAPATQQRAEKVDQDGGFGILIK
jgi:hypothetical protein